MPGIIGVQISAERGKGEKNTAKANVVLYCQIRLFIWREFSLLFIICLCRQLLCYVSFAVLMGVCHVMLTKQIWNVKLKERGIERQSPWTLWHPGTSHSSFLWLSTLQTSVAVCWPDFAERQKRAFHHSSDVIRQVDYSA